MSIDIEHILSILKRRVNTQNNNPPITGEGIQNLLNIFLHFGEIISKGMQDLYLLEEMVNHLKLLVYMKYARMI